MEKLTREEWATVELLYHVGHSVAVVQYGIPPVNVAVECEDCYAVLVDYEVTAAVETAAFDAE